MRRNQDEYLRLSSNDQTQDITDLASSSRSLSMSYQTEDFELVSFYSPPSLRPSSGTPPSQTGTERGVGGFSTFNSKEFLSSGINKIKDNWDIGFRRVVHKSLAPIPGYTQGSVHRLPAIEVEPTKIGRGLWQDQLLVDRSLRTMALTMALFAFSMIIVLCVYAKPYRDRPNKFTSSVGGSTRSCKEVKNTTTAFLLLINIAGTMVLGMSNTYQQLITSLTIRDIKPVLEKLGDSRVGTNSPFNINHKSSGKKRAWAAWILLVSTSLPIHFLANSLVGTSYVIMPPNIVEYNATDEKSTSTRGYSDVDTPVSFLCWSAFRTGRAHFPQKPEMMSEEATPILEATSSGNSYRKLIISYAKKECEDFRNTTTKVDELQPRLEWNTFYFQDGECASQYHINCHFREPEPIKCRLNVRMSAAFVLTAALVIKAVYMITINILARGHRKEQLLTFGDVLVASATHPEIRVQGECMVNAKEAYRRKNKHTCHKHCRNKVLSATGDEIGHCQSCKKFNLSNKLANEPQPTIAAKLKRSFVTNLGSTAVSQMVIMVFTALLLLSFSLLAAVMIGSRVNYVAAECNDIDAFSPESCNKTVVERLAKFSGGWGGINQSIPISSLPFDNYGGELSSFGISNGAQFIYSLLYLMLIYNLTLISQEYDWSKLEHMRKRLRTTLVQGDGFTQDYLLQLPKKILIPTMTTSILVHWLLGEALYTQEAIWLDKHPDRHVEHSQYIVAYALYPLWTVTVFILAITAVCRWAFTYRREGFIPQMFGSVRVLCSATTQLDEFPSNGIKWGDLGEGGKFRHAGLSGEDVMDIIPYEIYAGTIDDENKLLRKDNVVRHE